MTRLHFLVVLALACLTSACGSRNSDTPTPVPQGERASPQLHDGFAAVALPGEVGAKLKWHEVAERQLPRNLLVTGKVQFNEDQTARVLAPIAGQVTDLRVRIGDSVQAGDVLFSLRSREVAQLVTDYLQNQRELSLAEKTFTMTKDLFDHQAASRIALQQAESEVAKEKAELARAAESLKVVGLDPPAEGDFAGMNTPIRVHSPLSGTIIERTVTTGQFVQPESGSLLTIADLSTVWVLADVFERDIRFVKPGLRGDVTTTAYPDRKFTARVARLHDVVDPETRTVKVRFLVSNPEQQLKPEMFASVSLFLADSERTLIIPASAVFTEGGSAYVFVQDAENRVRRRKIASTEGGSEVRVMDGLRPGERVATEGVLLLRQLEREGQ